MTESCSCFSVDCISPVEEELDVLEAAGVVDNELRSGAVLDDADEGKDELELDC